MNLTQVLKSKVFIIKYENEKTEYHKNGGEIRPRAS